MQGKSHQEVYQAFIDFITSDIQRERSRTNRRMMSVFLWCFLIPALSSITVLILVKMRILPRSARNNLDWVVLVLPVLYSLYILGSEVLLHTPAILRRGGGALTLEQSVREGAWRQNIVDTMERSLGATADEWQWVVTSFRMDLKAMQYRTKFLTALAGSVFFLIMQGIDSLTDGEGKVTWVKSAVLGWIETSGSDISQFVGLSLFLVLLYLSGSQTYQSMTRYGNCAELILLKKRGQDRS
jgi:hypothetical protein